MSSKISSQLDEISREAWFTFQELGPKECKVLCEFLVEHPLQVTRVNLNGNLIGDEGAIMIADAIRKVPSLLDLNLAGNGITDVGCRALCESLRGNRNLISLCLLGNMITDNGGMEIARLLAENNYLQHLYLYLNHITEKSALEIARATANNKQLATLWLDHNLISLSGSEEITRIITTGSISLLNFELTAVGGETIAKKDSIAIKLMQQRNSTFQEIRKRSAKELLHRRASLILLQLPFPTELLHLLLFTGIQGFDVKEEAFMCPVLLNRRYLGEIIAKTPQDLSALKKQSLPLTITGNELVRQCETIFLAERHERTLDSSIQSKEE